MSLLLLASLACNSQADLDAAYAQGHHAGYEQGAKETHEVLDPQIEGLGEKVRDGEVYRHALEGVLGGIGIANVSIDRYHLETHDGGRLFVGYELAQPGIYYTGQWDTRKDPTACTYGITGVEIRYDDLPPDTDPTDSVKGIYRITGVNHDATWFPENCPPSTNTSTNMAL